MKKKECAYCLDRQTNYDLLRIISSYAVVLIHTNARYFLAQTDFSSIDFKIEIILNYITRFSVPCFVMLSGAFVLSSNKTADIRNFYNKSFRKIVIPFLVAYIFWCIVRGIGLITSAGSLKDYLKCLAEVGYGNLWFMPMIIGIYLFAPFIVRVKNNNKIPIYVGGILVFWAMISQATTTYSLPYSIGVVGSFMTYFIMGNILYENQKKHNSTLCILVTLILGFLGIVYSMVVNGGEINPYKIFFAPHVVALSISVFCLFRSLKIKNNYIINWIANRTFYIYLVHTPVISLVMKILDKIITNEIVKIIIGSVCVFLCSLIVILVGERIEKIFKMFRKNIHDE